MVKRHPRTKNRNKIRAWLVARGITGTAIARAEGISNALVCSTIGGTRNNRKVLGRLLALGCPAKLLHLPDDMQAMEVTP